MSGLGEIIDIVAAVNRDVTSGERLWVCLLGETGTGKTTRGMMEAKRRGLIPVPLLPGTSLPEDILGLPRVRAGTTEWTTSDWVETAAKHPSLVFIDEIDKAREETLSSLLTLLSEVRVRDRRLHPNTIILCAGQPVDVEMWLASKTGEALSARLLWYRTTEEAAWRFLEDRHGVDLSWLPKSSTVQLPILPRPAPRQIGWWLRMRGMTDADTARKIGLMMMAEGVVGRLEEEWAEMNRRASETAITNTLADPERGVELIKGMEVPGIVAIAPRVWLEGHQKVIAQVYREILLRGGDDDGKALSENVFDVLSERIEEGGGVIEVPADELELSQLLVQVVDDVSEIWTGEAKKKKKEGRKERT